MRISLIVTLVMLNIFYIFIKNYLVSDWRKECLGFIIMDKGLSDTKSHISIVLIYIFRHFYTFLTKKNVTWFSQV